jgi:hypothetical protein
VTADDVQIYSKKALGRHAAPGEVMQVLQQKTG